MSGKGSRPRPYSVKLDKFDSNWDAIFGKKHPVDQTVINAYDNERLVSQYDKENMSPSVKQMQSGSCGCGRSPTGNCCGWHGLTESQYQEKLATWQAKNPTQGN